MYLIHLCQSIFHLIHLLMVLISGKTKSQYHHSQYEGGICRDLCLFRFFRFFQLFPITPLSFSFRMWLQSGLVRLHTLFHIEFFFQDIDIIRIFLFFYVVNRLVRLHECNLVCLRQIYFFCFFFPVFHLF